LQLEEQVVASDVAADFKSLLTPKDYYSERVRLRAFYMKNTLHYLYTIFTDFEF
jgi:hypothetical protein